MHRRPIASAAREEPVSWRGGVHIAATSIWCDARRAQRICFVSHADAVPASQHGQLIASLETLALLAQRPGRRADSELAAPFGRPFTLGTRRLELLRSGHAPGSASLLVEVDGKKILYASAINPRGGWCGAAEVRKCDVLVLAARYGHPRYAFPFTAEIAGEVSAFAGEVIAGGGLPVLLVTTPSKGIEVAAWLHSAGLPLYAHRSIHHALKRLQSVRRDLPAVRRWTPSSPRHARGAAALLWQERHRDVLDRLAPTDRRKIALVSGRALEPARLSAARVDAGFPWSSHAGHTELLDYIDHSGAECVYLTDRYAEAMAAALDGPARRVRSLGPPRQMSLF